MHRQSVEDNIEEMDYESTMSDYGSGTEDSRSTMFDNEKSGTEDSGSATRSNVESGDNSGISEECDDISDEYPWQSIIENVFKCQHSYGQQVNKLKLTNVDKTEAKQQAYENMKSTYDKVIMTISMNQRAWFR